MITAVHFPDIASPCALGVPISSRLGRIPRGAVVAQLVEHFIRNERVGGSIPLDGSSLKNFKQESSITPGTQSDDFVSALPVP